jgi:hypothetical protein
MRVMLACPVLSVDKSLGRSPGQLPADNGLSRRVAQGACHYVKLPPPCVWRHASVWVRACALYLRLQLTVCVARDVATLSVRAEPG